MVSILSFFFIRFSFAEFWRFDRIVGGDMIDVKSTELSCFVVFECFVLCCAI